MSNIKFIDREDKTMVVDNRHMSGFIKNDELTFFGFTADQLRDIANKIDEIKLKNKKHD